MGAWIEIGGILSNLSDLLVAPLVGAWIEICPHYDGCCEMCVAPLVGAWIEIIIYTSTKSIVLKLSFNICYNMIHYKL